MSIPDRIFIVLVGILTATLTTLGVAIVMTLLAQPPEVMFITPDQMPPTPTHA